jgi:hypothetical protein
MGEGEPLEVADKSLPSVSVDGEGVGACAWLLAVALALNACMLAALCVSLEVRSRASRFRPLQRPLRLGIASLLLVLLTLVSALTSPSLSYVRVTALAVSFGLELHKHHRLIDVVAGPVQLVSSSTRRVSFAVQSEQGYWFGVVVSAVYFGLLAPLALLAGALVKDVRLLAALELGVVVASLSVLLVGLAKVRVHLERWSSALHDIVSSGANATGDRMERRLQKLGRKVRVLMAMTALLVAAVLAMLCAIVAALSYRGLELPFPSLFLALLCSLVAIANVGLAFLAFQGRQENRPVSSVMSMSLKNSPSGKHGTSYFMMQGSNVVAHAPSASSS